MTDFEKIPERVSSHNLERSRRSSVLQGDVRRRLIIPVSLEIDFVSWETPRKFEISLTMAVPKCSRACHCHAVRIEVPGLDVFYDGARISAPER